MLVIDENLQIPFSEMDFSFARSSGAGGQNVNKVNSKAILKWNVMTSPALPEDLRSRFIQRFDSRITKTGDIVIASERFRDNPKNMADCIEKLRAMLAEVRFPPKTRRATKPTRTAQANRIKSKKSRGLLKKTRGRVRET